MEQTLQITVHVHVANWREAKDAGLSDLLALDDPREAQAEDVVTALEAVPFCERHGVVYTRYEKNGRVAYLHDQGSGWCRYSG